MKTKMMTLCLVLGSWAAIAQHDHAKHGDEKKMDQNTAMFKDAKLGTAYEHYIHLKDALVASKSDEATKTGTELQKSLTDAKGSAASIELAAKLANASDLTEQRRLFSLLSNEMATLVKD